ncbi:MAG: hypothetical protein J0I91_02250 [Candidatus Accumulibacter sp.]|nr:hypothetical protein [Accumulibacter sp.]
MNNLACGTKGETAINKLKLSGLAKKVDYEDYSIKIYFDNFSIEIGQPENNSRLLAAWFHTAGCSFLFENVWYAIKGENFNSLQEKHGLNEQEANDNFIQTVINFILEEKETIMSWPPIWFIAASEHLANSAAENFPDIAQAELNRNRKIWDTIKKPTS